MRSHAGSTTSAPPRGHGPRDRVHGDVDVDAAAAAGWPLAGHGNALPDWSAAGEGGPATEESRSFETLAQEVEELVERQPQFAFLKPCRQLEQHYANKRNTAAGNSSSSNSSSFRYCHGSESAASEATASTAEKGGVSSSESVADAQQKPGSSTMRDLLSCDGIELDSFVEGKSDRAQEAPKVEHPEASPRRSASERRPHGRGHFHRNSGERIWRISSTRCSIHEKEAHIDLVAPASAKFLVEMSPGAKQAHASPPAVAVPFKWEDAPGRAKAHAAAATHPTLQLPPRLAAPLQRSSETYSRQLHVSVISHPLAGFFPCMGAASPSPSPSSSRPPQPQDLAWMHYRASKSYGGVYQETALPKPGGSQRFKPNKSFSQPLTQSKDPKPQPQPRRLFSSELGRYGGAACSDPSSSSSSILHGSRQSSSSRTYLSCDLDASTPRTAGSKSSSSASYESIGEDFDQDDSTASPRSYAHHKPAPHGRRPGPGHNAHRRSEPKGLLNLCKTHGHCLGKQPKSGRTRGHHHHPEVWAPTLATYFQRLDVTDVTDATDVTDELLDKPAAAPTSSGYLNSRGEPVPLQTAQQSTAEGSNPSPSPEVSPKRPTRLPYKMPSVAEQERGRHQRQASAKSLDLCPSPAYTAALEMLSPAAAVTLMASRRHQYRGSRPLPSPKPHRRVQFILSMCKTLKRVLFRQQARRSVIGTRLMYHDERHAPTTFQFSKPN